MRVIEGEITLTTPLHIASPGTAKLKDDGYFVSSTTKEAKSVTTVVKTPIVLKDPIIIEHDDKDDKIITRLDVPTINANLLRGRIRRECANMIFESLCEREETVPLQMAHVLTCLSTSGSLSGDKVIKFDYHHMARKHIFAGVWGGGTNLLPSGISVYNAMPIHDYLLENGYTPYGMRQNRRDDLSVSPSSNLLGHLGLTFITHLYKRDDVLHFRCPILNKVITNYNDVIREYQDRILEARKSQKEVDGKKTDLDNMFGTENVMPGTSFTFRMELADYLDDAQVGMLLLALERMKERQGLGGSTRYGLGRFEFEYDLYDDHRDGTFSLIDEEITDDYKQQAREGINAICESDLMTIYREPESKEEKAKKKAKTKKEKMEASA